MAGESKRGRQSHSTLPLGAIRAQPRSRRGTRSPRSAERGFRRAGRRRRPVSWRGNLVVRPVGRGVLGRLPASPGKEADPQECPGISRVGETARRRSAANPRASGLPGRATGARRHEERRVRGRQLIDAWRLVKGPAPRSHADTGVTGRPRRDRRAAGGLRVFDHSGAAAANELDLRDTKVVIFGSPAAGTPVMEAAPPAALDLPLKILVWDDGGADEVQLPRARGARGAVRAERRPRIAAGRDRRARRRGRRRVGGTRSSRHWGLRGRGQARCRLSAAPPRSRPGGRAPEPPRGTPGAAAGRADRPESHVARRRAGVPLVDVDRVIARG